MHAVKLSQTSMKLGMSSVYFSTCSATRSVEHVEYLWEDSHHACATDKCSAIMYCDHITMGQDLKRDISNTRIDGCSEGKAGSHLYLIPNKVAGECSLACFDSYELVLIS